MRRRAAAGFTDADADPRQRQLQYVCRDTRQGRHRTPYGERQCDQVAAVEAIGQ